MLALESKDAATDLAVFHKIGISHFEQLDFEREAKHPDGSTVKVAFSLAFALDSRAPDTGFFTCQKHYPENFWNSALQTHANGVAGIAVVTMVAENPADHTAFPYMFCGESKVTSNSNGIAIQTARGAIQVMDHISLSQVFCGGTTRSGARRMACGNTPTCTRSGYCEVRA